MRGRGWQSQFPVGNTAPGPGLPLIDAEHWDTGVQGRVVTGPMEWMRSVTTGSLANPRVSDDNDGRSLQAASCSVRIRRSAVGASGGSGAYLARTLTTELPPASDVEDFRQRAAGADVELSAGRWELRGEADPHVVVGTGDHSIRGCEPALTPLALWGEGRVRVCPASICRCAANGSPSATSSRRRGRRRGKPTSRGSRPASATSVLRRRHGSSSPGSTTGARSAAASARTSWLSARSRRGSDGVAAPS